MTRPRHSLDQLLVLDTIIRTGSFSSAAKALHRVPSAITYAIRTLEESLDLILFEKQGRRSVLTDAGHRVLEQARLVLSEARSLDRLADEIGGEWEPTVQVVADAAALNRKRNWLAIGMAAALPTLIFGTLAIFFYLSRSEPASAGPDAGPAPPLPPGRRARGGVQRPRRVPREQPGGVLVAH